MVGTVEIDGMKFKKVDRFYRFSVYHNPEFDKGIAMCKIVNGEFDYNLILIGKEINYFTKEELEVIYWHEVGHLAYDHLKDNVNKERMLIEYEADFFSFKHVGADRLIQVLAKTIPICKSEKGRKAVKKRIKKISFLKTRFEQLAA